MLKILVVDDIPDNVKLLAYDLEDAGYEVITAYNGKEALEKIHAEGPSIVLTDWMMPVMDGLELCRVIRSSEAVGFIYIIMLTAHSDKDRLVEAFEAGADDFLSKPFHPSELMARLGAGVRIVKLEADLAKHRLEVHKANAELVSLNERLDTLATTDELTGLANRREAMRRLDESWAASQREQRPLSCILFDIDHFKRCNDTYGHDAGDAVLRETAAVITRIARTNEHPSRFGGEEFLMVCPSSTPAEAAKAAERIREAVAAHVVHCNGNDISVTISLGVASRSTGAETPEELIKQADEALYQAKESGRNKVCVAGELAVAQGA